MKSTQFLFALGTLFLAVACSRAPEGQKVEDTAAVETPATSASDAGVTYAVNTANSIINWTGSKPAYSHMGTAKISSGEFIIDMNSIENKDLEGEKKAKLEGHLKTGDFFETEKFPTGKFTIASVAPASGIPDATHTITGNLTLRDKTRAITIPANIAMSAGEISAVTPSFTINRTNWDINFNSGVIGTAADKLINDEIGLVISLKAEAPQAIQ